MGRRGRLYSGIGVYERAFGGVRGGAGGTGSGGDGGVWVEGQTVGST